MWCKVQGILIIAVSAIVDGDGKLSKKNEILIIEIFIIDSKMINMNLSNSQYSYSSNLYINDICLFQSPTILMKKSHSNQIKTNCKMWFEGTVVSSNHVQCMVRYSRNNCTGIGMAWYHHWSRTERNIYSSRSLSDGNQNTVTVAKIGCHRNEVLILNLSTRSYK